VEEHWRLGAHVASGVLYNRTGSGIASYPQTAALTGRRGPLATSYTNVPSRSPMLDNSLMARNLVYTFLEVTQISLSHLARESSRWSLPVP
jgi:hypothetical protein